MEVFGLGLKAIIFLGFLFGFNLFNLVVLTFYLIWMNLNAQWLLNTQDFEEERQPFHTTNDRCVLVDEISKRFTGRFQRRWSTDMIAHPKKK